MCGEKGVNEEIKISGLVSRPSLAVPSSSAKRGF